MTDPAIRLTPGTRVTLVPFEDQPREAATVVRYDPPSRTAIVRVSPGTALDSGIREVPLDQIEGYAPVVLGY